MDLNNIYSATGSPLSDLGEEGSTYMQVHEDGRILAWTKRAGAWSLQGSVAENNNTIQTTRFEFNNDQIIALSNTYLEIVPAPGDGKMLVFIGALIICDHRAGDYGSVTDPDSYVFIGYGDWNQEASTFISAQNLLTSGGAQYVGAVLSPKAVYTESLPGPLGGSLHQPLLSMDTIINQPLKLIAQYDTALTGGDASNTLSGSVIWTVVDV